MTAPENIRRHTNGSIDRQHYMQIGRQCRTEAFYEGVRMVATAPPDLDKDWKEQRYNLRQSRTQLRIGKLRFAADALRREGARAFIAKLLK